MQTYFDGFQSGRCSECGIRLQDDYDVGFYTDRMLRGRWVGSVCLACQGVDAYVGTVYDVKDVAMAVSVTSRRKVWGRCPGFPSRVTNEECQAANEPLTGAALAFHRLAQQLVQLVGFTGVALDRLDGRYRKSAVVEEDGDMPKMVLNLTGNPVQIRYEVDECLAGPVTGNRNSQ